MLKAVIKLKL